MEIEKLKKCFDRNIWSELIEFFKRLSSLNPTPDVMIFTSRKAISFFDAMNDIGLLSIGCFITSDRIIDQNLDWLVEKRVVIVDESIVSGTTLNRLIEKLNNVSVIGKSIKSIEVYAFSTNLDFFEKELLKDHKNSYRLKEDVSYLKRPFQELSNSSSIKFSSDVVTSLSVLPRPYCVDFPIYDKIVTTKSVFSYIINNSEWDSDDISSNFQRNYNVFSITLTPNSTACSEFDNIVGCNLSRQSLLKIRIYGRIIDDNKIEIQFVPMVIVQPISIEDIKKLFNIVVHRFFAHMIVPLFDSDSSKLRLFQYLTSAYLLKSFFNQFSSDIRDNIEGGLIKDKIQYAFHPNVVLKIIEICNSTNKLFDNYKLARIDIPNIKYNDLIQISPNYDDILNIQSALTEPFIKLYEEKEIPARELVLKHKSKVFRIDEYKKIINRLNEGYSIIFLKEILKPLNDRINVNRIISIFLDKSIDRGILVPILANNNDVYYRAFRHGEDVLFGIKEENLCAQMFKKYTNVIGNNEIDHLWAEKMLIFFIKYGIKLDFLSQKFDMLSNNSYRISIKNYLHGPVPVKFNTQNFRSYLNPENQSIWLTSILVNKAILSLPKSKSALTEEGKSDEISSEEIFEAFESKNINRKYQFNNFPIHDFHDAETINNAKKIGDIFGILKRNPSLKLKPRLRKDIDLAILAACLNPDSTVGALAAEINIFQYHWSQLSGILSSIEKNEKNHLEISILLKNSTLYTAINSGQVKYFSFFDKIGVKIIQNIQSDFEGSGYEYIWAELWPQNINWTYESIPSNLISIIQVMGLFLLTTNIYIRILNICLRKVEAEDNSSEFFKKELKDLTKYREKLNRYEEISKDIVNISVHRECFNIYIEKYNLQRISEHLLNYIENFIDEIQNNKIDNLRRIKFLVHSTNELVEFTAHQILQKVDEITTVYGKEIEFIRYNNVVFLTFERRATKEERAEGWNFFTKVKEEFIKFNHDVTFLDIPMEQNKLRYGRFLCIKSNEIGQIFKLIYKFFIALENLNIRIVLFPNLPEEYTITQYNINSNQDISTNFFYDKSVPIIGSLIKDFNQKEFVLVRDEKNKSKIDIPEYIKSKLIPEKDKNKIHEITRPTQSIFKSFIYSFKIKSPMKNDVFISYSHYDIEKVKDVKNYLLKNNIGITIDSDNLTIGDSIPQFITTSVRNTEITLSFVSTQSLESTWVALESAFTLQLSNFSDKRFLVCLLDNKIFDPLYKLDIIKMVDEKIDNYKELINISLDKKVGIADYADDLDRYNILRNSIDKIINHIKNHLALDLSKGYSDKDLKRLVDAIKPSR